MAKEFAYSVLAIKEASAATGKRIFRGIATTPTADRVGDIVEPKGAVFKLPLPLCWMHNTRDPVGWVHEASVGDEGIEIEGEIANLQEPFSLKDRLDTAWAMLTSGLVRGLSIGFNPIESARIEGSWASHYLKWEWLELSPVTVAANGDCSLTAIKSIDQAIRRAASGALPVVRLGHGVGAPSAPGVSGPATQRRKAIYLNDPERN